MLRAYQVINAGTHANPPPTMWAERFPAAIRDRAPRFVEFDFPGEGVYEALLLEGKLHRQYQVQVGHDPEHGIADYFAGKSPYARSFLDGPEGQRDPHARLAAQDLDGVDADIIVHPGYPIMLPRDRVTRWGMMVAFNGWLADFCAVDPARLIGIGEIPMWDPELAVSEARRIAKLGLRGVMIPAVPGYEGAWSSPADAPYTDPVYDPIWAALDELGLVIVIHADAAAATPGLEDYDRANVNMLINKTLPQEAIVSLIVGGVFHRFPNLRLVCVETGVGWMAHLVSWMEVLYRESRPQYADLPEPPSETFRRHVSGSFLWDTIGVRMRDVIGIENMMWCNDFPHSYGPWPHSDDAIRRDLSDLTGHERGLILAGNAQRIFRL